jgi:hypothetical protein
LNPDGVSENAAGHIEDYLYNNIFYKPTAGAGSNNFQMKFFKSTVSDYSLMSDYNSWVQNTLEVFTMWGANSGSDQTCNFNYGTNGPGHSSGNWYAQYGCTTSPPANGTGHYHQDAHSKGTGATDTTLPPFTNVKGNDYTLTAHYAGTNLSTQPWYIPEMGTDRNRKTRTNWDIGAYEYGAGGDMTPPSTPQGLSVE